MLDDERARFGYFLLPGWYLSISRLKFFSEKVSWVFVNPAPIFILSLLACSGVSAWFFICFSLAFLSWQAVYEIGYLHNDAITTINEKKPTLRVSDWYRRYIVDNFFVISVCRFGLFLSCLFVISIVPDDVLSLNLEKYVVVVIIAAVSFFAHNSIRSRFNIITYFFLSSTKYLALPLLFYAGERPLYFILIIIMIFPFLRTMEHARKSKYEFYVLSVLFKDVDLVRPLYYLAGSLIFWLLFFLDIASESLWGAIIFTYFLVFRTSTFFYSRFFERHVPDAYK